MRWRAVPVMWWALISAVTVLSWAQDLGTSSPASGGEISRTIRILADGSGDYPTLAAALAAAPAGATIQLGEGVFTHTASLWIDKPVQLLGAGMDLTEITSDAPFSTVRVSVQGRFSAEGITFRHRGSKSADVVIVDARDVSMKACRFTGAIPSVYGTAAGLRLVGKTAGVVSDCTADSNSGEGVLAVDEAAVLLERNTSTRNTSCGVSLSGSTRSVLRDNKCSGNASAGIQVAGQAAPELYSNTCESNGTSGIHYDDSASGTAGDNRCIANEQCGIWVHDQAAPMLDGNTCRSNKWGGIAYFGDASGTARSNQCSANEQIGINVGGQAAPMLEGNTCQGNKLIGIAIVNSASGTARKNRCLANEQHGIVVGGQATPTLEDNICQGNRSAGIMYGGNAAGVARSNQCTANEQYGVYVGGEAAPTLEANDCGSSGIGIYVVSTAQPKLAGNMCHEVREGDTRDPRYPLLPIYLGVALIAALSVWVAYRRAMHDSSLRYRTFWPRLWAQSVDGCILMPFTLIPVVAVSGSYALVTALSALASVGYFAYAVILHGLCGQTVGKRVTKVRVVDARTGGRIRWRQAVAREAIPLAASICLVLEAAIHPEENWRATVPAPGASDAIGWLLTAMPLLWALLEMVTMLANEKRRALHDYIAGTIVERTSVRP